MNAAQIAALKRPTFVREHEALSTLRARSQRTQIRLGDVGWLDMLEQVANEHGITAEMLDRVYGAEASVASRRAARLASAS